MFESVPQRHRNGASPEAQFHADASPHFPCETSFTCPKAKFRCAALPCSRDPLAWLEVALLLGEDAAAVFMHIKPQLAGALLPGAEERPEVAVEKPDMELVGGAFGNLAHQLVLLIRADEERGGEAVKAARGGGLGSGKQTELVAFHAAIGQIVRNGADEGAQGVFVALEQRQTDRCGIFAHAVAPCAVFREGVDIRVVPEARQLDALLTQRVDALIGAGRAADV